MKVRDIMSTTPIVARESTPLGELARLMLEYRIGCVPIVDALGALVGIVTEADFIWQRAVRASSQAISISHPRIRFTLWCDWGGRLWRQDPSSVVSVLLSMRCSVLPPRHMSRASLGSSCQV